MIDTIKIHQTLLLTRKRMLSTGSAIWKKNQDLSTHQKQKTPFFETLPSNGWPGPRNSKRRRFSNFSVAWNCIKSPTDHQTFELQFYQKFGENSQIWVKLSSDQNPPGRHFIILFILDGSIGMLKMAY